MPHNELIQSRRGLANRYDAESSQRWHRAGDRLDHDAVRVPDRCAVTVLFPGRQPRELSTRNACSKGLAAVLCGLGFPLVSARIFDNSEVGLAKHLLEGTCRTERPAETNSGRASPAQLVSCAPLRPRVLAHHLAEWA